MNYGKHISTKSTPQTEPILGMTHQVKNNAGGYVFEASSKHKLERFLTIGSEGGTFYVDESKLTKDNAKSIIEMIQNNGQLIIETIKEFANTNRAPKADPLIFVTALACTFGSPEVKANAYTLISRVCKTSTHLFTFLSNIQELRGWSRGLRTGVAKWYTSKSLDSLAYQLVKYRQRNGWTHADAIRLSHPSADDQRLSQLLGYAVGKVSATDQAVNLPSVFEDVQTMTNPHEVAKVIKNNRLTWEMLPTEMLKQKVVWEALLQDMPLTAMIRNLGKMTSLGMFESNLSDNTKLVVSALTNKDVLKKANIHPVNVLNTLKVYGQGRGDKGSLVWTPNSKIVDSLEEAFELSFECVEPSGKNLLVAVDVSGSMDGTNVNRMVLNAKEVASALSLSLVKSEPNVDLIWFDTKVYKPTVGKRTSFASLLQHTPRGGGTDCSLAFRYALENKLKYDGIIILTDNETWAGPRHAIQVYADYKKFNPNIKSVNVGMVANDYSLAPSNDYSTLHVAGFDSSVPKFINEFIKG